MRRWLAFALLAPCLPTAASAGQSCRADLPTNTPASRFEASADGTVVDRDSGLRWRRCAEGQQWADGDCHGRARAMTLAQARRLASGGWRLPSLVELSAIAELGCHHPAIDLALFPATPAGAFWTATPLALSPGTPEGLPRQWRVNFVYGENELAGEEETAYVRLVSGPRTD